MFGCRCCRCSKSIESLDLSKPYGDEVRIAKREKLTNAAEPKSYKKLRLSSFIPESYFVNSQHMNLNMNQDCKLNPNGLPSTSQLDRLGEPTTKAKMITASMSANTGETKPKLTYQPTLYEDEAANEAETLIGPNHKETIERGKKNKKSPKMEKLEMEKDGAVAYNFDYNLYSIKKNISVWCIDIALLTSNGQTLKNLLNSGSQHLSFLFENKLTSNDLTLSDELLTTTTANPWSLANSTGLIDGDYERRKFNELWSFYLFMFNLALVCSSIVLQLLVGILLLLNTKSSRKNPSMPRRSGECYNHLILIIILFITVINVFIVIFTGDMPPSQTTQPVI